MDYFTKNVMAQETLADKILRRVMAGKEGAVRIFTNTGEETRGPRFWRHSGSWSVPYLRISLATSAGQITYLETDFSGELLMDDRGDGNSSMRLVLRNDAGQVVLSTDRDTPAGSVMVVAIPEKKDAEPLTILALFQGQHGSDVRSAATWDASKDWLFFANMAQEMLEEKQSWDA